jgi:hypothetical protein
MPLEAPVLDDRNFEEILEEAKRRIPVHTPEWTNFDVESDPGITLVQVFSFLTDSLLYRANRVPELNRIKFLQLLDVPLQPAAAARGIVTIRNDRGPMRALPLDAGVVVSAGNVNFLTRDGVNVLPVEARIFYKRAVPATDERLPEFQVSFAAVQAAAEAALAESLGESVTPGSTSNLQFYETIPLAVPTPGVPNPVLDIALDTLDGLYIALLAPANVAPEAVRPFLAHQVLSIGVVPALSDTIPPLQPLRTTNAREPVPTFVVEVPSVDSTPDAPRYRRLQIIEHPDVFDDLGVIQVKLPDVAALQTWSFGEPLQDGVGGLPPRIEDEQIRQRIITWVRLRLPADAASASSTGMSKARVTWIGINAARVSQAIPITNELLGTGNGEPDQELRTATTPVIPDSVRLEIEADAGQWHYWRLTDDLLAAEADDEVFTLDAEAGLLRFGDGLRGARPPLNARVRISYEYGGGAKGNVAIGAISRTADVRLQAGYKVSNPVATYGGDDGETVEEGEGNIPLYLRHRDRLVTAADFRDIVRRTPGVDVGRVEVLSLYNPTATQREPAPGNVTIMVIPATDPVRPRWPIPDRLFLRTVCDYVEPRRLVTTEIHVRGPEYIPVYVSVGIRVREGHFQDVVRQAVDQRLHDYLAALPPGGPDEVGWPLNRQLLAKDLEAVVTRIAGVEFVEGLEMGVNATLTPIAEPYPLAGLELPWLAALAVTSGPPEPLANIVLGAENSLPADQFKPVPVSRAKC